MYVCMYDIYMYMYMYMFDLRGDNRPKSVRGMKCNQAGQAYGMQHNVIGTASQNMKCQVETAVHMI